MCLYPKLIKNRKYTATKKNGGKIPECKDTRVLAVPMKCGECMECKKQLSREWQARLQWEIRKKEEKAYFITLTFSDKSIAELSSQKCTTGLSGYQKDNAIAKRAVRLWLERHRKRTGKSMKHWLITELGHNGTENIHMHGILWTSEIEMLEKEWKYGFVWIGKDKFKKTINNYVSDRTVNYIIKYITKPDYNHVYFKPKILCSAGIGSHYEVSEEGKLCGYEGLRTKEYFVSRKGTKVSLPIYWRNKIYTEEQREQLWLNKLDEQKRYVNGIEISIKDGEEPYYRVLKTQRQKALRLGFRPAIKNWEREKYENERRILLQQERINRYIEREKKEEIIINRQDAIRGIPRSTWAEDDMPTELLYICN